MLQQPLARRVAGAARYAAAGEALPGALPLSSMRRRARGPASSRSNRWNDGCLDDGGASGAGRKRSGLPGEALEVDASGLGRGLPRPKKPGTRRLRRKLWQHENSGTVRLEE